MSRIASKLKHIDLFGVTYSPAISDGLDYKHSSPVGGIISLIIGILSLLYCGYYLYLWQSLSLLPKVTADQHTFTDDKDFGMIQNHITIYAIFREGLSAINPFKKEEIIIFPLIVDLDDGEVVSLINNATSDQKIEVNIQMGKEKQYMIIFSLCKEEYLDSDSKCASQEVQQQYFEQIGNQLYADIEFTTFNPSTFLPEKYERTYQFYIHSGAEMCSSITLHYIMNNYLINKAFLFSTEPEEQNYISDTLNFSQYGLKSYCDNQFLPDTFGAFWIVFSQQYSTIQIGYPSISEVLAAIGSITSVLFSVKYLITSLNLSQMRQTVLDDIMVQYYPEIKQFKILKNIFGKITTVKFRGLNVDLPSYLTFQDQIHKQMACKLNYKNLLYEMSRLQFILLSLQRRNQIEKVHNVGIKVPLLLQEHADMYIISQEQLLSNLSSKGLEDTNQNFDILRMEDALLLSYEYKRLGKSLTYRSLDRLSPCLDQFDHINEEALDPDFYDANHIKQYIKINVDFN